MKKQDPIIGLLVRDNSDEMRSYAIKYIKLVDQVNKAKDYAKSNGKDFKTLGFLQGLCDQFKVEEFDHSIIIDFPEQSEGFEITNKAS